MDGIDSHTLLYFLHITLLDGFLLLILSGSVKAFASKHAISRFVFSWCQGHFARRARRQEANHLNKSRWWHRVGSSSVTRVVLLISECGEIAGSWMWTVYFCYDPSHAAFNATCLGKMEHQAANHAKTAFVSVFVGLNMRLSQQTLGSADE